MIARGGGVASGWGTRRQGLWWRWYAWRDGFTIAGAALTKKRAANAGVLGLAALNRAADMVMADQACWEGSIEEYREIGGKEKH